MRAAHPITTSFVAALLLVACGDDDDDKDTTADSSVTTDASDTTAADADTVEETAAETTTSETDDTEVVEPPGHPFAFGLELGQSIGAGPFPNNVVLGDDGAVEIAPLGPDPRWGGLGKASLLARTDAQIARRKGFSFASSVYFPMTVAPDLATFEDHVHFIALDGPEVGTVFPAEVFWTVQGDMLGAFPRWGHYLVPGSTYAVIVDVGVETEAGATIEAHPDFAALMAADAPVDASAAVTRARTIYADLRAFMATRDTAAVIGTVFTTEDSYAFLDALMDAARDFPLVTPTRRIRSTTTETLTWEEAVDVLTSEDLEDYFGIADDVFGSTPGGWGPGNRASAAAFTSDGEAYDGGTFAGGIGGVINGTIAAPSFNLRANETTGAVTSGPITFDDSGAPEATATVLLPFTLYLCNDHVDNGQPVTTAIPIAIFTHGGSALRSDALAYATVNCLNSRATIAMDLPFHGGRQTVRWFADAQAIVPVHADIENTYKAAGAAGRTTDYVGDNGGATTTVGGFFALTNELDPEVIEANHLAIAVETETLVRYLKDPGATGLGAGLGLTFDTSTLVHESLSFGTSFGSAFLAQTEDIAGAIVSVGSGQILSINLPMAPNNANLSSNLFIAVLGLQTPVAQMTAGAYRDPLVSLFQWLAQRGDPIAYAPFVLRHRKNDAPFHVIGFGDSWDETLFTPAQVTFANAWGVPVYTTAGFALDPTTPGVDTIGATAYPDGDAGPTGNLTVGDKTVSAGYFFFEDACHAQVIIPICESNFVPPYPPITPRAATRVFASPICAMQSAMRDFLGDIDAGGAVEIEAPADPGPDDCSNLYK